MTTTDPLTLIRDHAPDERWSEPDRAAMLDEVMARAASEPERFRPARRPRRLALVGLAAAASLAAAGTAAAATGVIPASTYNWMLGPGGGSAPADQLQPATARKVFAVRAPDGTEYAGWTAENSKGWQCVTTLFEPAGTETSPYESQPFGSTGSCSTSPPPRGLFATGSGSLWGPADDRVDFVWDAGDAVRAELRVSTGATYPVTVQDGWLGGWYDVGQVPFGATATLVVFGADDQVLARRSVQDQGQCDRPGGC